MKNLYKKRLLIALAFILAASFAYALDPITLKDSKTKMTVNLYPTVEKEDKELLFYSNERFGYSVLVPKIFTKVVTLPTNGDGMILESKSGKEKFRVSGGLITEKEMLKKTYNAACKSIGGENNASFYYIGDVYWELCWWKGNTFYSRKFLINDEEAWCDCEISYPSSRDEGTYNPLDKIIYRAIQSLAFPVG